MIKKFLEKIEKLRRYFLLNSKTNDQKSHGKIVYLMTKYFHKNNIDFEIYKIHDIVVVNHMLYNGITIVVTLERPGIFIGRKGKDIDDLRNFLKVSTYMDVEILLKESNLWNHKYVPMEYMVL